MDALTEAQEILALAQARSEARAATHVKTDYKALNRMIRRQKAALTRAKNSGDPERVILACRDAVREWNEPGAIWPDAWSLWQHALDDVLPWNQGIDLADLA